MSQEKCRTVLIYERIYKEYVDLINNSYTDEEERTANKIREAIHNTAYDDNNINDFINIFMQIIREENLSIELLSKLAPKILIGTPSDENYGRVRGYRKYCIVLKEMIEKRLINLNYQFTNNSTLWHILFFIGNIPFGSYEMIDLIKLSLKYGYDVNKKDNNGNTILHLLLSSPRCPNRDALKSLLELISPKFNYNAENNDGYNIFEYFKYIREGLTPKSGWYFNLIEIDEGEYYNRKNLFYSLIESLIPKDRACLIKDKDLKNELDKLNFKANRLYMFLQICNFRYIQYEINENDTKENLRNQIDVRPIEINQLKTVTLSILADCFPEYENDILEFILNGTITPAFHIIYTTLLTNHITEINRELLMLPLTPDKTFLTFVELFRLECGCNKVVGDIISRKLEVTSE